MENIISFSLEVKKYLCGLKPEQDCCAFAELSAIISTSGTLEIFKGGMVIELRSENPSLMGIVDDILLTYFGTATHGHRIVSTYGKNKHSAFIPKELTERIFLECGIAYKGDDGFYRLTDGMPEYVLSDVCCIPFYVRGAFLGSGYVSIPSNIYLGQKSVGYTMEWIFSRKGLADGFCELLTKAGFSPKTREKSKAQYGGFSVYFKDGLQICDVLAFMGASKYSLKVHSELAERSVKNRMQRDSNCTSHNFDKTVTASAEAIRAIITLERSGRLKGIDSELREIALLRREFPSLTLNELKEKCSFKISKSGLKFKLDKLISMSNE